jgi:hypothetical protein
LARLAGLGDDEYRWEPVAGCWTIRPVEGTWTVDPIDREADPAPLTTIAWRLWHISIDCFESYSERAFDRRATGLPDDQFVGNAIEAVALLRRTVDNFLAGFDAMGDDVTRPLGPAFGPFAEADHVDLALHALRELVHHGAEISLLRDLWQHRNG